MPAKDLIWSNLIPARNKTEAETEDLGGNKVVRPRRRYPQRTRSPRELVTGWASGDTGESGFVLQPAGQASLEVGAKEELAAAGTERPL